MLNVFLPVGEHRIDNQGTLNCDDTRSFIVFGEELTFFIKSEGSLDSTFQSLSIFLNETCLTIDSNSDVILKHNDKLWEVVMAPLHDKVFDPRSLANQTSAKSELIIECKYRSDSNDTANQLEEKEYLEPYALIDTDPNNISFKGRRTTIETETYRIAFPVYSLMNIRLRNVALRSKDLEAPSNIISSLDIQLARLFEDLYPEEESVVVEVLSYELHDGQYSVQLNSMDDMVQFPLILSKMDSYTLNYALEKNQRSVSISITYHIQNKIKIYTTWETEVSLKRTKPSRSVLSSNNSTPKFIQTPKTLLPRVLSLAQFNFLNSRLTVQKGVPFTLYLQIENTTSRTLNLVIYHRPKTSSAETVILLTNDSKVPLLEPGQTIHCRLELIAIAVGYHKNMKGLKIVDLDASDVIDIGYSVSLLVE